MRWKIQSSKTWSASSPRLPKWDRVWSCREQNQAVRSPRAHGSEVAKRQNTKLDPLKWKHGSWASKSSQVHSWSLQQKTRLAKYHGYPKLPGSVYITVPASPVEKYLRTCVCTYEMWNYLVTYIHVRRKVTPHSQKNGNPKCHQVFGKYFLCVVLITAGIQSSRYLLHWNSTRSNKFLNEQKSELNMRPLLVSSRPCGHWLACNAISMVSNVDTVGKFWFQKCRTGGLSDIANPSGPIACSSASPLVSKPPAWSRLSTSAGSSFLSHPQLGKSSLENTANRMTGVMLLNQRNALRSCDATYGPRKREVLRPINLSKHFVNVGSGPYTS